MFQHDKITTKPSDKKTGISLQSGCRSTKSSDLSPDFKGSICSATIDRRRSSEAFGALQLVAEDPAKHSERYESSPKTQRSIRSAPIGRRRLSGAIYCCRMVAGDPAKPFTAVEWSPETQRTICSATNARLRFS